jgi:L-lactate dehydrogenase complex protein LldG
VSTPGATSPGATESGDRSAFLDRLRRHLAGGIPQNHVHPPLPADPGAPPIEFLALEGRDAVDVFCETATDQGMRIHRVPGESIPDEVLEAVVEECGVTSVVLSAEPEARALQAGLTALGCAVASSTTALAARADLGVTSAVAAVAATGSLVLDCRDAGSRTVSLLPRVHLCVLPAGRVVAAPADVLRPLGRAAGDPGALASNLVLVSGPSRTGDIEQLLTIGVHGPVAVHVVLLGS